MMGRGNILLQAAFALSVVTAAGAQDDAYRPARCGAQKRYAGPPLKAPPSPARFEVGGSLAGPLDAATSARLEEALPRAVAATGAREISVAVSRPGAGTWSARHAAGGAPAHERFWWASAGKMFTAVVVLQLAEEGRLSLDDPIERYVEGVPNGRAVTLRHLLEHTSGLYSANEDPAVRARPGPRTLRDDLEVLRRRGAMFCPGEHWRYSNTGYTLLGAVIEKVAGGTYAEAVEGGVLARLGPTSLRVLAPGDAAGDVAPAAPRGSAAPVHPASPGAAGGVAGRAEDMNRFLQALLGSELLRPRTTAGQFDRLYPMFGPGASSFYGLGVMLYEPPGAGIYWLGHGGGAPGAQAVAVWSPADRAFVSVALTGDGSPLGAANLLLRALRQSRDRADAFLRRPHGPGVPRMPAPRCGPGLGEASRSTRMRPFLRAHAA